MSYNSIIVRIMVKDKICYLVDLETASRVPRPHILIMIHRILWPIFVNLIYSVKYYLLLIFYHMNWIVCVVIFTSINSIIYNFLLLYSYLYIRSSIELAFGFSIFEKISVYLYTPLCHFIIFCNIF